MEVVKIYNNSIVLAKANDRYSVVIGNGCGFGKRPGDQVDEGKVELRFPFTSDELQRMNLGLLEQLDSRDLMIVGGLVEQCAQKLHCEFRSSMVFSLVDHIRNAEIRQYIDDEHPFRWIVKKLNPGEYECAKWMIDQLAEGPLTIQMPHSEATAIALHMINNRDASGIPESLAESEHVMRIVTIVEYKLNRTLDHNSLAYSRFVTHLRFLLNRLTHPGMVGESENNRLFKSVFEEATPQAREILASIVAYLEGAFHPEIPEAERGYLLLHLHMFIDNAT